MRAERIVGVVLALAVLSPAVALGETYDDALRRAAELRGDWELAAAAAALEPQLAQYPEDYAIHLQAAYYLLRAGQLAEALAAYRVTRAISDTADARWGMADALAGLGHVSAAREAYRQVLELVPTHVEATTRLEALGSAYRFSPQAYGVVALYSGHPAKKQLWAGVLGLDATLLDHWTAVSRYRRFGALTNPFGGQGQGTRAQASSPTFAQDEGYLSLGYAGRRWSAAVLGGVVSYRTSATTLWAYDTWLVGASGSFVAWARFGAAINYSNYADLGVGQLDLEARLPVLSFLDVRLGGEAQVAGHQSYLSGMAEVALHGESFELAALGRLGERMRPVDLDVLAAYNVPDRPVWSVQARASWAVTRRLAIRASYDFEQLRTAIVSGDVESTGQRVALGFGLSF